MINLVHDVEAGKLHRARKPDPARIGRVHFEHISYAGIAARRIRSTSAPSGGLAGAVEKLVMSGVIAGIGLVCCLRASESTRDGIG